MPNQPQITSHFLGFFLIGHWAEHSRAEVREGSPTCNRPIRVNIRTKEPKPSLCWLQLYFLRMQGQPKLFGQKASYA